MAVRLTSPFNFLGIGVFGSFTTFSTFSIEVVHLLDGGQPATALAYLLGGGLVVALAGQRLGSARG